MTHRLVVEVTSGLRLNPRQVVCHRCDNPPCGNPAHLFVGTQEANIHDCMKKGRKPIIRGEAHGHAKITESQVRVIRRMAAEGSLPAEIGKVVPLSRRHIREIVIGRAWAHVEG